LEDNDLTISSLTVKQHQHHDTTLTTLLENYSDLFQEPEGLPPARGHDHIIPLKEGSQPVNLRPYRYSGQQKDVLEKMVEEMLGTGIIRPSNSPFFLPCSVG